MCLHEQTKTTNERVCFSVLDAFLVFAAFIFHYVIWGAKRFICVCFAEHPPPQSTNTEEKNMLEAFNGP